MLLLLLLGGIGGAPNVNLPALVLLVVVVVVDAPKVKTLGTPPVLLVLEEVTGVVEGRGVAGEANENAPVLLLLLLVELVLDQRESNPNGVVETGGGGGAGGVPAFPSVNGVVESIGSADDVVVAPVNTKSLKH